MIERYIRVTVTAGAITIEPGLEWRPGDDFALLTRQLTMMAKLVSHTPGDPIQIGRVFGDLVADAWPGRAYFVEVFAADGGWSQTFLPYGVPRRRAPQLSRPDPRR